MNETVRKELERIQQIPGVNSIVVEDFTIEAGDCTFSLGSSEDNEKMYEMEDCIALVVNPLIKPEERCKITYRT